MDFTHAHLQTLHSSTDVTTVELVTEIRRLAKDSLYHMMLRLCHGYHEVPWVEGIEYSLWRAVVTVPTRITDEETQELEQLAERAGGWWGRPPASSLLRFYDLDEWKKIYAAWEASQ